MATNDGSGPPPGRSTGDDTHAMRRAGGARINVSKRIKLTAPGAEHEGWVLNISRGGVRLILEGVVRVGDSFGVHMGEDGESDSLRRPGRVVWVQEEPDGAVVGIEFTDRTSSQSMPAVPVAVAADPDAEAKPLLVRDPDVDPK